MEGRRFAIAGVSAFAAFIAFIDLGTFITFFARITFVAFVEKLRNLPSATSRLPSATALAAFIAFIVMAMQLIASAEAGGAQGGAVRCAGRSPLLAGSGRARGWSQTAAACEHDDECSDRMG